MEHPRPFQVCTIICIIYDAHRGRGDTLWVKEEEDLVGVKWVRVGLVPDVPLRRQDLQGRQRELEVGPQVLYRHPTQYDWREEVGK